MWDTAGSPIGGFGDLKLQHLIRFIDSLVFFGFLKSNLNLFIRNFRLPNCNRLVITFFFRYMDLLYILSLISVSVFISDLLMMDLFVVWVRWRCSQVFDSKILASVKQPNGQRAKARFIRWGWGRVKPRTSGTKVGALTTALLAPVATQTIDLLSYSFQN